MTYRNRAHAQVHHFCVTSGTSQRGLGAEGLEAVLHRMSADDLRQLRASVHDAATTAPTHSKAVNGQHDRVCADHDPENLILLGAVAVAIAWWTHRAKPAPETSILQGIDVVGSGHAYLLPIPRHDPCFCGSDTPFRTCHGQPPNAMPSMSKCVGNAAEKPGLVR